MKNEKSFRLKDKTNKQNKKKISKDLKALEVAKQPKRKSSSTKNLFKQMSI
jgi:hypothetical protein